MSAANPIYGRLSASTGRLTDVAARDPIYPDDVPLDTMPNGRGPFAYDPQNRAAMPGAPTADEQLSATGCTRVLAALALLATSNPLTPAQRAWAQAVVDSAAARVQGVAGLTTTPTQATT